jgi:hypothetical protein
MPRRLLIRIVAAGFGLLALALLAVFAQGFLPRPAAPEPVLVLSLDKILPDSYAELEWQGRPVVVYRPGVEAARGLLASNARATGVQFEPGALPPAFVYHRSAPVQGCALEPRPRGALGPDWPGGWSAPCRAGAWDVAGRGLRDFNGAGAAPDLTAPPHRFRADGEAVELR